MQFAACEFLESVWARPWSASDVTSLGPSERRWLIAGAVVLLAIPTGYVLRSVLLGSMSKLVSKTAWKFDDELVASLRRPLPWWCIFAGVFAGTRIAPLDPALRTLSDTVLAGAFILTGTLWMAGAAVRLFEHAAAGRAGMAEARSAGVVRYVVRLTIWASGALVLLSTVGISITPVLTTVGVGGIAVALGLQETLANLFAGMQVTLAGNLRVGDFVKLESGDEGFIDDIQWRVTRVRTLPNNLVLVPNSRFAQSVVTNYSRPTSDLAVLVQVGVHYSSDLERVERVTCGVAREIMQTVPGAVPEFQPFVRFHTFGPSSIDFSVIMRGKAHGDQFLIKHEFVKALKRAYEAEKITIPFPIVALNVEQERRPD